MSTILNCYKDFRVHLPKTRALVPALFLCCFSTASNSMSSEKQLQTEINALKKQLHHLEKRISKEAHVKKNVQPIHIKRQETTLQPIPAKPKDKKIHLNGITLTPGGFFAGEGVWRSRNLQSDLGTPFNTIPFGISPLAHMRELKFTARQTRLSLLVEGNANPWMLLSGYIEIDFFGNGTANENESNSFNPRMRNLYATIDQNDSGWHLLAGQSWSLVTAYQKGIIPRSELLPTTIDPQYVVGFVWKRQSQFRLTKNFGENLWFALSLENPQTTFGSPLSSSGGAIVPFGDVVNITYNALGNIYLPGFPGYSPLFSLNQVPDVIGKIAIDQTLNGHKLHMEGFGIYRDLYDRVRYVNNINVNKHTPAGGGGATLALEIMPGFLDIQGSVMGGTGIGSYSTSQLPDATIASNGALAAIPEISLLGGITVHATKALDLYLYGGTEREKRKYFQSDGTYIGYGIPTANNTGCNIENASSSTCAGVTQSIWQITAGLWDKIYQGNAGEFRFGLQYSYVRRSLFSGTANGTTGPIKPSTNDNIVLVSLRYFPFLSPPAAQK